MALGASGPAASGAYGVAVANAVRMARLTGRPVQIPGSTLVASPNGNIGTPGGGFGGGATGASTQPVAPSAPFNTAGVQGLPGSPSGPAVSPPAVRLSALQQPSAITNQPVGSTVTWPWWLGGSNAATQPPLNQANPNMTAGISGLAGGPSGAAVAPPGGFQPPSVVPPTQLPDVTVTARRYRAQHGLAADDDSAATDRLNAESLAAAQAGRTSFNPQLAAQYGQPLAAGAYGPQTNVVNALAGPATSQPIMLAPTVAQPQQPVGQNLLQQGLY